MLGVGRLLAGLGWGEERRELGDGAGGGVDGPSGLGW